MIPIEIHRPFTITIRSVVYMLLDAKRVHKWEHNLSEMGVTLTRKTSVRILDSIFDIVKVPVALHNNGGVEITCPKAEYHSVMSEDYMDFCIHEYDSFDDEKRAAAIIIHKWADLYHKSNDRN